MGEKPGALRVLIADDNRDTVLTLGILVRSEGYIVRLAESGKQALAAATYFQPDIVLLDLGMPEVSGFDVAQEFLQRYGDRCPVLIAVTAHRREEDRRRAASCGFRYFVPKPYNPDALISLLGRVGG
ncbi:MAG TPA: response regulator [Burkholderiales bacterium]|jgi:CheY-like chemotaxis protein|nr:response regulator [Burkholderiales bacterium]